MTIRSSSRTERRIRTAVEPLARDVGFEEATHTYRLPGEAEPLPSVTQILAKAGFVDWHRLVADDVLEYAALRGTAVHKAAELIEEDDLDWDALDPQIHSRVSAYVGWRKACQFRPLFVEQRMVSRRLGYAGTADLVGLVGLQPAIVDLKAVDVVPKATPIQTVAYAEMLGLPRVLRFALRLDSRGTFRLVEFPQAEYASDLSAWRSALTLYRWRNRK